MAAARAGIESERSFRFRWNQGDTGGLELRRLLAEEEQYMTQSVISHSCSYDDEYHMTATFFDDNMAAAARKRYLKLKDHKEHIDNLFDGVTLLQSPEEYDLDICAVHGLGGNAMDTFTGRSRMWLRDLLPQKPPFDKARIMTFGYNSKLIDRGTVAGMQDWADTLLRATGSMRRGDIEQDKPLLFICHSMGGLVVRKAMERLHQFADMPDQYPGIRIQKCGILFLSTPHLGTTEADYGNLFSESLASLIGLRKDAILKELKSFNTNAMNAVDMWRVMANRGVRPPFQCLCESRRTKLIKGHDVLLVKPAAASFLDQAAIQLPDSDHHWVCKFDSSFGQGYKDVIGKLILLRLKLHEPSVQIVPTALNLPGQPHATAYRYPLPTESKSYFGAALKRGKGRFHGREDVLHALEQMVESCSSSEENKIIALSGFGGAGKTEILLEYGYRARQTNHIFFCQASDGESFESAMYKLASAVGSETLSKRVGLADRERTWSEYNQRERVEAFVSWLQDASMGSSILVFDDVDAFQQAQDFDNLSTALNSWPHTVLLTTRDSLLGSTLANESHRDTISQLIDAPDEEILESIMRQYIVGGTTFSQEDMRSISRIVDGHVMSACRAVQYICQELRLLGGGDPVSRFLKSFQDDDGDHKIREGFLNFRPRPGRSLTDCFEKSIVRLGELEYHASRVLNFAAYLMVPGLNFCEFFQHSRPWLSAIPSGEHLRTREIFQMGNMEFARVLRRLAATSAIVQTKDNLLVVHRMMQEYLMHRQRHGGRINILRQIMLLAKVSIHLDEKIEVFREYVANCEVIAQRFQINIVDLQPPPELIKSIVNSGSVHMLRLRARNLCEQKSNLLEAHATWEARSRYEQEARRLLLDCEKAGLLSRPEPGTAQSPMDSALIDLCDDLLSMVQGINPMVETKLEEYKEQYFDARS